MARSPKFQYSTTRMLLGGSVGLSTGGNGVISGFRNRTRASKTQTSRHLRGVISSKLARASASLGPAAALVPVSLCRIGVDVKLPLPSAAIRLRRNQGFSAAVEQI